MRVILIGADFEENLGVGILAACVEQAGHDAEILPFNVAGDTDAIVRRVAASGAEVVGLSMQFQHRAGEFLALSRALRRAGYAGHVTCGGQFPTLAFREVLEGGHGLSSVVLHEGEETLVALLGALERGAPLADVAGLALLSDDGVAFRTAERRLPDDLDAIPFPRRYRAHNAHFGVPFVPLLGGRGCWGKCSYCSIVAFYRDGRDHGGGRLFRLRSPENVAAEMALLWHRAKGPCIFCFHDDNFTLPSPAQTLERVRAIRRALDEYGVGTIGIVGKARPDTLTPELCRELAALGVIRLYVGVENASTEGGEHLQRGTQQKQVRQALAACREAGIFNCYNLLVFEPGTTLAHVRDNAEFIREHADHPVNFCRAEPYHGTPLHLEMERGQDLGGSYLGWNYRVHDDRAELLFRISSAVFRERNFAPRGVANRYMGLGYAANVLRRFYPGPRAEALHERARLLTRAISLDTYEHLRRAIELAEGADLADRDQLERHTALLALEVAAMDRRWHVMLDGLFEDMSAYTREPRAGAVLSPTRKLLKLAQNVALGASMMAALTAAEGCGCELVSDPVPPDSGQPRDSGLDAGMVVDPAPIDSGVDAGMVVDPAPVDSGVDAGMVVDPAPIDSGVDAGMVVDPAPIDAGADVGMVVDPPPPPMASAALPEAEDDLAYEAGGALKRRLRLVDQWRDSSPREGVRTADLPLFDPPTPELRATRDGERLRVRVEGVPAAFTTRWEAEGTVVGEGPAIEWEPAGPEDRIAVAVRTRGGVAVVSLLARSV
jgi:radical SAM superfamily enzyme YgiQ (UPF0313 family)